MMLIYNYWNFIFHNAQNFTWIILLGFESSPFFFLSYFYQFLCEVEFIIFLYTIRFINIMYLSLFNLTVKWLKRKVRCLNPYMLRVLQKELYSFQKYRILVCMTYLEQFGEAWCMNFRKLTEPPYLNSIEWSKWHVFFVDERVVPKDHVDSNYKLANDGFLSKVNCWSIFNYHVYIIFT